MAVALKRKEDTIKREQAPTDEGDDGATMEVGFDVRRRKATQGAWKNAGKAIVASNNLQKLKALSKNAAEGGAAAAGATPAAASEAAKLGAGLSRGRTLSGNPVRNDATTLAQVAALSISAAPIAEPVEGQDSLGLMRPRSAAAMKRAMGLDRTSSARSLDGSSPSVALRRAMSNQADGLDNHGAGGAPVELVEDLKDRLGSVETAVDNMGSQLALIQNALEAQTSMLKQVLQQQKQHAELLDSPRRNGGRDALLGSDSESATIVAAEREIAKSITARSPEQSSSHVQGVHRRRQVSSRAETSAGAGESIAGDGSLRAPPLPSTAPPSGQRRKNMLEEEGDLNLDDEDISAMDVEALLAVRADGNI
eukprot:COSAG02_NODE_176_length_31159_cov_30.469833_19_plen_366_part_00